MLLCLAKRLEKKFTASANEILVRYLQHSLDCVSRRIIRHESDFFFLDQAFVAGMSSLGGFGRKSHRAALAHLDGQGILAQSSPTSDTKADSRRG